MMMRKEWRLKPSVPLAGTLLDRILFHRGLIDASEQADFLTPSFNQLHDPFALPDMAAACEAIAAAITARRVITIHGDYDVDGMTATALLIRFFRRLGVPCRFLIPDRLTDGYGLSATAADKVRAFGSTLLVTVDCGISSIAEVDALNQAGIQVIITDHHECHSDLPAAYAVVNPKRPDSRYPFRDLAGVGVALKLIQGLCLILKLGELWLADLELAALGSVADVVPLKDENRVIVHAGLNLMPQRRQQGLAALLDAVGLADRQISAQTLGYVLAPRINAAGRLGNALTALELLLTDDPASAAGLAAGLNDFNRQRQDLESTITAEAIQMIDCHFDFSSRNLIVVAHEGWHHGVIGIVASRLAEQYARPVIVLSGEDGEYRGSCRTWGDFDILAAISHCAGLTMKYGGHRKAAGLVVAADRLDDFIQCINTYAASHLDPDQMKIRLDADLEVGLHDLTLQNASSLLKLAPFGEDNPQPLLVCRGLTLASVQQAGNGRHLKLSLSAQGYTAAWGGIAFGLGDADNLFAAGDRVDILFSLEINSWLGRDSVQLNIRDLKHSLTDDEFHDSPWIADQLYRQDKNLKMIMNQYRLLLRALQPSRDEYKTVYQFIRTRFGTGPHLVDLTLLARMIARSYQTDLNMFRLSRILTVFQESNLIQLQSLGMDRVWLMLMPSAERVRLEEAPTYRRLLLEGEEV